MKDNSMVNLEAILAEQAEKQQLSLGSYRQAHAARLKAWAGEEIARRLWRKDGTVWVSDPAAAATTGDLTNRMGWLTLPEVMQNELEDLQDFSREIRESGFSRVVLLGMGGSSLAPGVFMKTFGNRPGSPSLMVLDSTHPGSKTAVSHLAEFLRQKREGDYVAIMAYVPSSLQADNLLDGIRIHLRDQLHIATTIGYGPRFLHSTGQLHKGGRNNGLFIQITHTPESDCAVPGEPYSFGTLIAAQALDDYRALQERGRRLIRFHLESDAVAGLEKLRDIFAEQG